MSSNCWWCNANWRTGPSHRRGAHGAEVLRESRPTARIARTESGYRAYDAGVLSRLAFIRAAQAVGLTIAEIREVIRIRDAGSAPCAHVLGLIERHRTEVQSRISQLQQLENDLTLLAARGVDVDPSQCDPSGVCKSHPVRCALTGQCASRCVHEHVYAWRGRD